MINQMNPTLRAAQLSGIRVITAMAQEIPDCVLLSIGEPDFDTPEIVRQAAKEALDAGLTHYPPTPGVPAFLEAISEFERKKGYDYAPNEIVATIGATEGLSLVFRGILNPGDEVIVPTPYFGMYRQIIELAGGVMVPLDTAKDDFQITREKLLAAISPKTKGILLNSPNNPTGVCYHQETLEMLKEELEKQKIFVVCDDVYDQLVYTPCKSFAQFRELKDRMIVVQSFSKPYAMTGWRLGYVMADAPIAAELSKLHLYTCTCIPSFIQYAGMQALQYDPAEMVETYRRRRDYVCSRIAGMGLELVKPEGAFYCFPSIQKLGMDSETFAMRLLKEAKVAVVPGKFFDAEGFVRISYCYSDEGLEKGMDRMERFLRSL